MTTPTPARLPFIDWMKAIGMALIVLGHVGGGLINHLTPPFYPKQLGVAFFLYVAGFSLARDRRPSGVVVPRRLFEVFVIGLAFAALMSTVGLARDGDPAESNYLPFLLGANVVLDYFPANPTTWYIGTYIHAVLLGALVLRYVRIQPWMLATAMIAEILARTVLMRHAGLFVAYMLLANWATVYLMGFCVGQAREAGRPGEIGKSLALLGLLIVAWPLAWSTIELRSTFPFKLPAVGTGAAGFALVSTGISLSYAAYTWSIYRVACRLRDRSVVRFFARNTLFIFVAHMPLYYALDGPVRAAVPGNLGRVAILFVACYVGLAVVSEFLRRLGRLDRLRDWLCPRGSLHVQADTMPVTSSPGTVPR